MHQENYFVSAKKVTCYFDAEFSYVENLVSKENAVIITDEHIMAHHSQKFDGWKVIAIRPGEEHKQQHTADFLINKLIEYKADRQTFIIGIGGGVVTDITGYVASIYMRGVKFGFVPTTILAMVDAALGGKNGVDVGLYKNLAGTINQPQFLLYDHSFLSSLPQEQWVNGFAEIIKHACIKDAGLFSYLEENKLEFFQSSSEKMDHLIRSNVGIKYIIVSQDEFEKGDRKLLNFGHTLGHAIENIYTLPHGHAVSIGIAAACILSQQLNKFSTEENARVISLLKKYHLPVSFQFDKDKMWELLLMDKKKSGNSINFVLLNKIGDAIVRSIPLEQLQKIFNEIEL